MKNSRMMERLTPILPVMGFQKTNSAAISRAATPSSSRFSALEATTIFTLVKPVSFLSAPQEAYLVYCWAKSPSEAVITSRIRSRRAAASLSFSSLRAGMPEISTSQREVKAPFTSFSRAWSWSL